MVTLNRRKSPGFWSSRQDFFAEGLGSGTEIYLRQGSWSQSKWKRLIVFSSQYVAELTATRCCGCPRSTMGSKNNWTTSWKKKPQRDIKDRSTDLVSRRYCATSHSMVRKSPAKANHHLIFSGLYAFLQEFTKSHCWRQDMGLDGYLVVLSKTFLMSFVGQRKWTFANTRI